MNLSSLTRDQYRKYYESRLDASRWVTNGPQMMSLCPFHADSNPSMALDFEKGAWHCHACKIGGGVLDFEKKFDGVEDRQALEQIADVLGEPSLLRFSAKKQEAIYEYRDEYGALMYQVVKQRQPNGDKTFKQRKPDGNGGWEYKLGDVRRVLYNLDEVITAREVIVVEGEKDADNLREALKESGVAVTTCMGGAGSWKDDYAKYFGGKRVIIFPDNDEPGKKHGLQVARSVVKVASGVKIVELPDLPPKGDVSDFLELTERPVYEISKLIKATPLWQDDRTEEQKTQMLVSARKFLTTVPEQITWVVKGMIQEGANGFITAPPKGGKSWLTADLALRLALGLPFMGCDTTRRVKTAVVSREDAAALTGWRLRNLLNGMGAHPEELDGYLYINTKQQTKTLMLDDEGELGELIDVAKKKHIEFMILDVFNILHGADENDNTEMRQVMARVGRIQAEVGCQVCIVHHDNKNHEPNAALAARLRGASAIAGFAEFMGGISVLADRVRKLEWESKAAATLDPIFYQIESSEGEKWAKHVQCAQPPEEKQLAARNWKRR